MSILEKVKGVLGQNPNKGKSGVQKAGDMADEKTGGKYAGQVDSAQSRADDMIDQQHRDDGSQPTP